MVIINTIINATSTRSWPSNIHTSCSSSLSGHYGCTRLKCLCGKLELGSSQRHSWDNLLHSSKDQYQCTEGISRQTNASSANNFHRPEQPDQPVCWYFMSTGSCKYGSDCKYHHPKDRIDQLAMTSLGLQGLPMRPGTIYSDFSMHGIYNYGTTCKFDHPIAFNFSNYGFGCLLYLPNQSPFQHQINLLNCNSSETSPLNQKSTS